MGNALPGVRLLVRSVRTVAPVNDNQYAAIFVSSKGPLTPRLISTIDALVETYGVGTGVKELGYQLGKTGIPVVCRRVLPTARAAYRVVNLDAWTGANPATATGTPNDYYKIVLEVTTPGAIGVAVGRYSTDGGDTFTSPSLLADPQPIGATGVSIDFGAGNLDGSITVEAYPAAQAICATTISRASSSTASATITGTPLDVYPIRVEVLQGGTLGSATPAIRYRVSLDDGRTWQNEYGLGVDTSITLRDGPAGLPSEESTGLTLTFGDVPAVAATGSITTVAGADLVDGETFTLDDGVNAPTVFEFDSNASVTPGNVAVTFTGADSADDVRDAILAAVNGVGAGLAITAADGGAATVDLENDTPGAAGNVAISETVANVGFVVAGMSGGADVTPGTLDTGDVITAYTTEPVLDSADVSTALTELRASSLSWEFAHVVDPIATFGAGVAAVGGTVQGFGTGTIGGQRFTWALNNTRRRYPTELLADYEVSVPDGDFQNLVNTRVAVAAEHALVTCPITGRRNQRSVAVIALCEFLARPIQEEAMRVATGALSSDIALYEDGEQIHYDAQKSNTLNFYRFITLRTFDGGPAGVYVTRSSTFDAQDGEESRVPRRRVLDLLCGLFQQILVQMILGDDLVLEDSGRIDPGVADLLDSSLDSILQNAGAGRVSALQVAVDRATVLTPTTPVRSILRVVGLKYVDQVEGTAGFVPAGSLGAAEV